MFYSLIGAAGLLATAAVAGAASAGEQPAPVRATAEASAEQRLEQTVRNAIFAEGPLFTGEERAEIERVCGMAPGSWDGTNFSIDNDDFRCSNGQHVDSRRLQRMMVRAAPRIAARVQAAMARPEVVAALDSVTRQATEEALRQVHQELGRAASERSGD